MLTLTGPANVGKPRLAAPVVATMRDECAAGVVFDLTPITDPRPRVILSHAR